MPVTFATYLMTKLGIWHTFNTRVGNDSFGMLVEAILSGAPLQCWNNSTRGLDSANALGFCKNLHLMSEYAGTTACVAMYQASQNAYEVRTPVKPCLKWACFANDILLWYIFNKVVLLYEARQFLTYMGFDCPPRQTIANFLASLTSPNERRVQPGYEAQVPRTPSELAQ